MCCFVPFTSPNTHPTPLPTLHTHSLRRMDTARPYYRYPLYRFLLTVQILPAPEALQEIASITATVGDVILMDTSKSNSSIEVAAQSLAAASSQAVQIIAAIRAAQESSVTVSENTSTAVHDETIGVRIRSC